MRDETEMETLCATVKHLRAERLEIQRILASSALNDPTEDDDPPYSTTELVEGVRFILKMKDAKVARIKELQSQLEQLRAENGRLEKVIALWFGPNSCSVCGGAPLASGKPCVCGGKGTMQAEHEGLRQALYDADISGTKIQQERDSLRGTLSALNNCRNKPVCGHCNALLREAESQYQGK